MVTTIDKINERSLIRRFVFYGYKNRHFFREIIISATPAAAGPVAAERIRPDSRRFENILYICIICLIFAATYATIKNNDMETEKTKCLIVGSGPAGYTAASYVSRAGFTPILSEGMAPGGQLTTTTRIENFPGFPDGIDGGVLMENMKQQAIRYGADIRMGAVTGVDFTMRPFRVTVNGEKRIEAEALIIATGAEARYLGLESEQRFRGMGVSACATCDGFFYRGQDVVVVGGGDSACEEAAYLATICRKVYMIVRKDRFRASKAMQERVMTTPNIEIRFETTTQEVLGDDSGVTGVRVRRADGREEELGVTGFFVAIGHQPNTEIFRGSLELDDEGYIKTAPGSCRTNIVGVFAAGDVQDPHYRQAITAAGSGCAAALECERFLLQL